MSSFLTQYNHLLRQEVKSRLNQREHIPYVTVPEDVTNLVTSVFSMRVYGHDQLMYFNFLRLHLIYVTQGFGISRHAKCVKTCSYLALHDWSQSGHQYVPKHKHITNYRVMQVIIYILIIGFCILLRVTLIVNNNTFCFATIDKVFY
jgi:hypothetical protein